MKKVSRLFLLLLAGFILLTQSSFAAEDNLLENPAFDAGFLSWKTHWTESSPGLSDVWITWEDSNVSSSPYAAAFYASNAVSSKNVTLSQLFNATSGFTYTASALLKNNSGCLALRDGAYAYVALEWYSSSNSQIGTTSFSDLLTAANDAWEEFSVTSIAPEDTAYGKILLGMYVSKQCLFSSSAMATYFDNASVTVTPEPVSSVLFLAGGAALFLRRRRKTV